MRLAGVAAVLAVCAGCVSEKRGNPEAPPDATATDTCVPNCVTAERACGDDGCGGSCGTCGDVESCAEGICVSTPDEAAVVNDLNDQLTDEAPDLSCLEAPPEAPDGPETVRLFGIVDRFGSGNITTDVKVEIFRAEDFHPESCESEKEEERAACYAGYGKPVATAMSVPADEAPEEDQHAEYIALGLPAGEAPEECELHVECPLGYFCKKSSENLKKGKCKENYGYYSIGGVPTNTMLVVRSVATKFAEKWHATYVYNVYFFADHVEEDGKDEAKARFNPLIIHDGAWQTIPDTFSTDILEGHGAVGGRVRDCRKPGKRDSWPIVNATVGLGNPPEVMGYFNNDEDNTVPMKDLHATNILGRYAAIDVVPGFNRITGAVVVDGKTVSLGHVDFYLVPDALAVVSFPGLQPVLKK